MGGAPYVFTGSPKLYRSTCTALIVTAPSTNYHACDLLSNKEYTALVDSLLDEEDDVEPEFSMLKCQMIEDGTYYSKAAEN